MWKRRSGNAWLRTVLIKSHWRSRKKRLCLTSRKKNSSLPLKRSRCCFMVPPRSRSPAKSQHHPQIQRSLRIRSILLKLKPTSNQGRASRSNLFHFRGPLFLTILLQRNHHWSLRRPRKSLQHSLQHRCKIWNERFPGQHLLPRSTIHQTLRIKSPIHNRQLDKKDHQPLHRSDQSHHPQTWKRYQKVTIPLHSLAEELLVKETLDVRSIVRILGERPFPINKTFEAYLETEQTQWFWFITDIGGIIQKKQTSLNCINYNLYNNKQSWRHLYLVLPPTWSMTSNSAHRKTS